jgi:hypothetical protein
VNPIFRCHSHDKNEKKELKEIKWQQSNPCYHPITSIEVGFSWKNPTNTTKYSLFDKLIEHHHCLIR